ncbi:Ig-like domain-containing protein [Paenibacillus lactis]|uniref:Ig-like domain-containing protein n=1 Tax=Paenibacillus lactis TaxID=228574 RepID=UPI003D738B54
MIVIKSIKDYKKRIGTTDVRSTTINHSTRSIASFFKHSPSFEEVTIDGKDSPLPCQIVSDTKLPTVKYIIMYPGLNIEAGQLIHRKQHGVWLCLNTDKNDIYSKGQIEKCNLELKWVDNEGNIQIHPSVFYFNTRSNFGTQENRQMNLPDGRRQVTLQKNEHTVKLDRDDRFIFGNEAFKVIDVDYVSDEGLINLSFQSDQINQSDDNLDIGIANYYSKISDYKISILNGKHATIEKDQSLQINVYTSNKGKPYTATINYSVSDEEIAAVNENGLVTPFSTGRVRVIASISDLVCDYIDIQITDNTSYNYTVEIIGDDSLRVGRKTTYTCLFKNNGTTIPDESTFSLTSPDGSPTQLAKIISQDAITNTCTIAANDNQLYGDVLLAVSNLNGLSRGQKTIKIKSLF